MGVKDLSQYEGDDKVISVTEMQEILKESQKAKVFSVNCLMPGINKACGGFRAGELITVTGWTKQGKTKLCQTFTKNFFELNKLSLWFSFEVPPAQFIDCFGDQLPLIYMPKFLKASNLVWLEERIIESFQKYGTRIIFIDHLHYLIDMARIKQPSIEIGTVIRNLKLLAVREGFLIFLMCHTGKPKNDSGECTADDIRDSSMVGQESDAVLVVQRRPKAGQNKATCTIEFHRRTGVMQEKIWMEKQADGFMGEIVWEEPLEEPKKRKHWND